MKRQLLSANGKRALGSMLICCLWVCAIPAAARAQAKFSNATCSFQMVNTRPATFQIKGTAQVTGLNPLNASTTVTFTFETRANANANWTNLGTTVQQTTNGVNGTANFDTGWQPTMAAGQGVQYRVSVTGSYIDGNGNKVPITPIASTPITPNP